MATKKTDILVQGPSTWDLLLSGLKGGSRMGFILIPGGIRSRKDTKIEVYIWGIHMTTIGSEYVIVECGDAANQNLKGVLKKTIGSGPFQIEYDLSTRLGYVLVKDETETE